ncbi:MAG: glycoside hydrolase family 44 protein [Planctomycetota bacterium]|nr:glycoside hydrolase family 44 protein [Planctomycetota bacterium]
MRKLTIVPAIIVIISLAACAGGGSGGGTSGGTTTGTPSLAIATQPAGAQPATAFTTQPVIEIRDAQGALDTADSSTVVTASIQVGSGTSGAILSGTTSVTASAGVASFGNLQIDQAGSAYRLVFSASGFGNLLSAAFNVGSTGGTLITPSAPPASQVYFSVHSQQDVRAISRYIYGMNGVNWGSRPANLTFARSGGNRLSAWNWENNASNAGTDWYNENDWALGLPTDPLAYTATSMIDDCRTNNAASLVTVPCIGYVAGDHGHLGGAYPQYDVNQTANYLSVRFKQSLAKKGGAFTLTPDPNDGYVYQDEFVNFLQDKYPGFATDAQKPIFFSLDNEPDLWATTHPRLRGDPTGSQGTGPTYTEMLQRTIDYADAIKDVEPNAIVFGPVNYGWQGFVDLQGASDAGSYGDFHTWYLQQLAAAETTYGHRLVDALDIHWYPEATGGGVRITADDASAAVAAARVQAPRSLWDTTYTEDSWVAQWGTSGPIYLLPRIQQKINSNYPGTKIAITEYYYGGGDHISGGIAQADVLGIYGRERVFAANLWRLGSGNHSFIYGGFEMFRDYDGSNGSFGNTSIQAANTDSANTSVYASIDAGNPNRMVIVCINKTNAPVTAGIDVTHTVAFNTAEVYTLTSSSSQPVQQSNLNITLTNAFQYTMPANSVTTLVLQP